MGVDEARTKYALKWEALRERVQASRTYDLLARVYANPVFKLSWFPLLTLPLLLLDHTDERKWRTAWVAGVMAFYWITEVLPIPVTAFLPLVLFPLFNVVPAKVVAEAYINDTLFILIGSFIVALAMERWGLHTRVALRVVLLMGHSPRRLLAGFMSLTAFISMWINNTATTSLMAPIALAVLTQINEQITDEGDVERSDANSEQVIGEDDGTARRTDDHRAAEERRKLKTKRDKGIKYHTLVHGADEGGAAAGIVEQSDDECDTEKDEIAVASVRVSQGSSGSESDKPDGGGDYNDDGQGHQRHGRADSGMGLRGATQSSSSLEDIALRDADPDVVDATDPFVAQPFSADERKEKMDLFVKGILLSVAYSASIGGTSTLVGTAPNLVLVNQFAAIFPLAPAISFFKWFLFATPLAIIFLTILWFYFSYFYCPNPELITINLDKVRERYQALGRMTWPEIVVLVDFAVLVVLWLTRTGIHELHIPGWADLLFSDEYVSDGTVAMMCAVVLFLLPSRTEPGHKIMDWESTATLPWGIVMLMGGGFALAKGFVSSGLSEFLGEELEVLESLPVAVLLLVTCSSLTFLTELTSNVATANVVLPILGSIAVAIKQSPLLLMIPGTISCSYAFMLPVATPPNAVIFAYGHFKVMDMVKAGLLVSAMGVVILVSASFVLAPFIFDIDFGELPSWAVKQTPP